MHTDREIREMHTWALALSSEYDALANAPYVLEQNDITRLQSVYDSFMILQGIVKHHVKGGNHSTLQLEKTYV